MIHNNDPYQPDVYILVIAGWYVYDLYQQNMNIYIYIYQFCCSSHDWLIYSGYDLYLHKIHINQLWPENLNIWWYFLYDIYIYMVYPYQPVDYNGDVFGKIRHQEKSVFCWASGNLGAPHCLGGRTKNGGFFGALLSMAKKGEKWWEMVMKCWLFMVCNGS